MIPQQTPRSDADVIDWAYNVWVRGDILKATGVKAASIDTSDKLYEFRKKLKQVNSKILMVNL